MNAPWAGRAMLATRALWWVVTRAVASIGTGRYGGDASKGVARGRAVMAGHHGAPSSDSAAGHTRRMNVVRAVPASGTHGHLLLPPSLPPSLPLSLVLSLSLCACNVFCVSLSCAPPPCAGHGLHGPTLDSHSACVLLGTCAQGDLSGVGFRPPGGGRPDASSLRKQRRGGRCVLSWRPL
jgi:hypothetical protein